MDKKRFTDNATGVLLGISAPKNDYSFIPHEMPVNWVFDPKLWPLLVDAKEALGTLNGIGQTLSDPHLLLRPLQSQEAITSSKIEGTYVTPEQLLLFGLDPREPKRGDEQRSDWMEVFNYNEALERGFNMLNELPLCNRIIREIHSELMHGVCGRNKNPGEFRRWQVQIGSTGRFIPPPVNEIDRLMNNLERYMNSKNDQYDPLVSAYIIHYQFEAIHPFGDGNGRIGRVILALMIYKWLGHKLPWLYMSPFFERYRDEYVDRLFKISTNGEWTEWIEFCLYGTIVQAKDSILRCHKLNCLKTDFQQRMKDHSSRTPLIIDRLFTTPVLTITETATRFNIRHQTAKSDLQRLVNVGIIIEFKDKHPRTYYSPEIMNIAYGDSESLSEEKTSPAFSANEQERPDEQSTYVYSEVALPPSLARPSTLQDAPEPPPPDSSL